jgi:hypothetical protein
MNLQLNHKYELVVGQPFSFYEGIPTVSNFATAAAPIVNEGNVQNFINTKDGDGLVLTNHHIEFEIDKSKVKNKGGDTVFKKLPVWDSPIIISELSEIDLRP